MVPFAMHVLRHAWDRSVVAVLSLITRLRLRLAGADVGRGLTVSGWVTLRLHPQAKVVIGEDVRINSGERLNVVGSSQRTCILVAKDASLRIDHGAGISNSVLVCTRSVTIGSGTLIGGGSLILDSDLHRLPIGCEYRSAGPARESVSIGADAFIGAHCIVLKGTSIGNQCVIGAGSVVHGTVTAGTVVAGAPARPIRVRVRSVT
jgi:acetyltransferase-like isoleucine patch superfamily enzyme